MSSSFVASSILVSVIIPARNEEQRIKPCFEALVRLDYPREAFEVILVDNGSIDRTREIAHTFSKELNLTILQEPGISISALRNRGVSKARGSVLAFLDADCLVPSGWLSLATSLLKRDGVGVVGAHYKIPEGSQWVARAWYGGLEIEKQGFLEWIPSGDLLVSRTTFEKVGGFDESLQTNEDCEFCSRVCAAGLKILGDASVSVIHLGTPQTLGGFYRKIRWHGTDGLVVFLRELPKITNARPLLLAFYTLGCVAGIGLGVVLAVLQKRFDVLAEFVGALIIPSLLLSLRMAFRRKKGSQLLPLTLLHVAYGMARAIPLLDFKYQLTALSKMRFMSSGSPPKADA